MVPRIHVPKGQGKEPKMGTGRTHVSILYREAKKQGVEFMLETSATALIYDDEKGVVGVKAESEGKDLYAKAKKGVILASGGFDHNKEMARAFAPQQLWALETGVCWAAPSDTGDGIKMAMAVGADLAGMGGTISIPSHGIGIAPLNKALPVVPGIWVNKYGQRFVNEAAHYGIVMRAVFFQEEHIAWAIFDEKVREMGGKAIAGIMKPWSDDLQNEIKEGIVKTGKTLAELSEAIGVGAGQLEFTVNKWNEDSAKNKDTLFHKHLGLKPMDSPPFFAARITEVNLGTTGGVKINTKAQVVDVNGQVIRHLYAGGMVAGGFSGPYYPGSGTAVAATVCFGRIAGKNAASENPWQA
jgi:fumarate reductase flavoprotein subunit